MCLAGRDAEFRELITWWQLLGVDGPCESCSYTKKSLVCE